MKNNVIRVAFDTNVLISANLSENGNAARSVSLAENSGQVIYSAATFLELQEVIRRSKFSRYIDDQDIQDLLQRIYRIWHEVYTTPKIEACRDPRDNIFLELAVGGAADFLITGDDDLLAMSPYRGVQIITPSRFLSLYAT